MRSFNSMLIEIYWMWSGIHCADVGKTWMLAAHCRACVNPPRSGIEGRWLTHTDRDVDEHSRMYTTVYSTKQEFDLHCLSMESELLFRGIHCNNLYIRNVKCTVRPDLSDQHSKQQKWSLKTGHYLKWVALSTGSTTKSNLL